jgi:hypothetical protein
MDVEGDPQGRSLQEPPLHCSRQSRLHVGTYCSYHRQRADDARLLFCLTFVS